MKSKLLKALVFSFGIIIFSVLIFISCNKQVDDKIGKLNMSNEQSSFIQSLETKGDNYSGVLIMNNKKNLVDSFYYDESAQANNSSSDINNIISPIIKKINQIDADEETPTDDSSGNSTSCKYCTSFGGVSCGKEIANKIPKDVGEVVVVISKKDSKGCRTITATW